MTAAAGQPEAVWEAPQRHRLVQLCAALSGDRDAAEDLAQETLLEAWRHADKLRDPEAADRWLAAIARHVCRRWARRRGRDTLLLTAPGAEPLSVDEFDVEVELERAELARLLDRALALLPAVTREVLVQRYILETPHAEIAARLGLSTDAVSMRISRGKLVLRRLFELQLRDEAVAYGLLGSAEGTWRQSRTWCSECGRRTLLMRRDPPPGVVSFRCPGCNPDSSAPASELRLSNPFFERLIGDLVRPSAINARVAEWSHRYYAPGVDGDQVGCTRCGRAVPLRSYVRDDARFEGADRRGLYAECEACGEAVSSSLRGLALALPEVRAFRREHPRTQAVQEREVDFGGRPALVVRYEDVLGTAGVDVVFARDTCRVLHVSGATA